MNGLLIRDYPVLYQMVRHTVEQHGCKSPDAVMSIIAQMERGVMLEALRTVARDYFAVRH
jgi:hypothetical protein